MTTLADRIDELLPQTQCTRCGYPDCRAYAEAIAHAETGIDRCPPGGEATLAALNRLLERQVTELDPALGTFTAGSVARIDESLCIGCTKCLPACPVDAIAGGPKRMHTVIEALCTGCELCLPPCPVDCIELVPARGATRGEAGWTFPAEGAARAAALRGRYAAHQARLAREQAERVSAAAPDLKAERQAEIAAALARVRARRAEQKKH